MLLSREEMTFDFQGARLEPVRDRELLGWVMNQFLYGEVTGIQCGHWLYEAPDLDAARFFARQAVEEFQPIEPGEPGIQQDQRGQCVGTVSGGHARLQVGERFHAVPHEGDGIIKMDCPQTMLDQFRIVGGVFDQQDRRS